MQFNSFGQKIYIGKIVKFKTRVYIIEYQNHINIESNDIAIILNIRMHDQTSNIVQLLRNNEHISFYVGSSSFLSDFFDVI